MSVRVMAGRLLATGGALLVLALGLSVPTAGQAAVPLPQATASATPHGSPKPSSSASEVDDEPADDPTDDGTNPTPDQTGTWVAIGGAAGLAVLAGLVVAFRKR